MNRVPGTEPLEQRRLLAAHFSQWSEPVSLGPVINSASNENSAAISKDGRSLYFVSNRPGGFGRNDIWVSHRNSVDDPWGEPANLGPTINTKEFQGAPFLSRDGHWLFFLDDGRGGFGLKDLFVSWRADKHDDFAWQTPINLGPGVNSPSDDLGPAYFEDDDAGTGKLYFSSDRPGGQGLHDLYVSERAADGTFGPAALVPELNSSANEQRPTIRRDGLEIFLFSDRAEGIGGQDLWTSTRSSAEEAWSPPANLGAVVNAAGNDSQPHLSPDGLTLFLTSDRAGSVGGTDLYVTTRTKLTGKEFAAEAAAVFPAASGADTGGVGGAAETATSLLRSDTQALA